MVRIFFTVLLWIVGSIPILWSQQFSGEKVITTQTLGARTVEVGDIDGDGFLDLVVASKFDGQVSWFRNNGDGTFSNQIIITFLQDVLNATIGDIDGDGDLDVIAISPVDDTVFWYNNTDGLGNFSGGNLVSDTRNFAYYVTTSDPDNDGDMDIFSGSDGAGIAWHENIDSQGTFEDRIINGSAPVARSLAIDDLDGDNDVDVVSSTSGSTNVSWYENTDGQGSYGPQQPIFGNNFTVQHVFTKDLDGDDDIDIISTRNASGVVWYENVNGTFVNETLVTDQAFDTWSTHSADLDNDGDNDILSASISDNKIAWYENMDGQGNFGSQQIISTNAQSARWVVTGDLDNDGDLDVISASQNDHKIAWYENQEILSLDENPLYQLKLFPNPTRARLSIETPPGTAITKVQVQDIAGKTVRKKVGTSITELTLSALKTGVYFITLSDGTHEVSKKIILQ